MTQRNDGQIVKTEFVDLVNYSSRAAQFRDLITDRIRGQAGLQRRDADRPSAHLRWALQQMRLRGWSNEQWGNLFVTDDETDGVKVGTGPICLLESVRAPFDAPSTLNFECIEQKYLRLAFKELKVDPVPVYLADWNDEQTDFTAVETVITTAIALAEYDEASGVKRFPTGQRELQELFGLTHEALVEADRRLAKEKATHDATTAGVTHGAAGGGAGVSEGVQTPGTSDAFPATSSLTDDDLKKLLGE
jgi:hypothetical protein